MLATITKESLTPLDTLASTSNNFLDNLSLLSPHIKTTEALYILLRQSNTPTGFVAVTYVPNAAPVRQKMLFASTRLTLVRELGLERFGETLVVTEADELTKEGWLKHEAHTKLAAPLTEEERELGEVKRLESEEGHGASQRKSHVAGGLQMNIADEAKAALEALKEGGDNLVLVGIDTKTEVFTLTSTTNATLETLTSSIPSSNPAFTFFRLPESDKVVYIYTCPSSSPVKERMLYASSSRSIYNWATTEGGLNVVKKVEESEPSEIEVKELGEEEKPKVEVKARFDRPKRPGRR